jgi:hypothetical protein
MKKEQEFVIQQKRNHVCMRDWTMNNIIMMLFFAGLDRILWAWVLWKAKMFWDELMTVRLVKSSMTAGHHWMRYARCRDRLPADDSISVTLAGEDVDSQRSTNGRCEQRIICCNAVYGCPFSPSTSSFDNTVINGIRKLKFHLGLQRQLSRTFSDSNVP